MLLIDILEKKEEGLKITWRKQLVQNGKPLETFTIIIY